MLITILLFVLVIVLVIFVHEFGHFVAAKLSGMKVEEFGFGFPPTIFKIKIGETVYSLNALPLGGFVKILGEDDDAKSPRSFSEKKVIARLFVLVAGVAMNFLLAIIFLTFCYTVGATPLAISPDKLKGTVTSEVIIADVLPGSSAQNGGIVAGDQVLGFDSITNFQNFTHSNAGKPVQLEIIHNNKKLTKNVTLGSGDSPLGVAIFEVAKIKQPLSFAMITAVQDTYYSTGMIVKVLGRALEQLVVNGTATEEIKQTTGPIGLFKLSNQVAKMGTIYFLQFIAMISINLGLINILPFPALDGGRAVFVALEGIFRRKIVRQKIESTIHAIGFVFLIILMIFIIARDIVRYY